MRRLAASAGLIAALTACSAWVDVGGRTFPEDAGNAGADARGVVPPDARGLPTAPAPDGRVAPPPSRPDADADAEPPPADIAFQPPPRDAAPPPPPPPPDAATPPPPDAAPPPPPNPCETCAAEGCAEALARCEADPGCVATRACVGACDRDGACRRACDDLAPTPTWFRYVSLEACLEARCGLPNECGPQGWGCGLTDAYRYDRGEGACWTCMQRDCCRVGLDCAQSVQCLQRVACLIGCFVGAPGCPGDAACRALPEAALSDGWIECVGSCNPSCP